MLNRPWACLTIAAGLLLGTTSAQAEVKFPPTQRPFEIFMVTWRGETQTDVGFRDYLAYEGIPVQITLRDAGRDPDRLLDIVAEIKQAKPDLVYTWGNAAAQGIVGTQVAVAARPEAYITEFPTITCMIADPVEADMVPRWESSGRNTTGTSHVPPMDAQVGAMRAYSAFDTLAVVYDPVETSPRAAVNALRRLAQRDDFTLLEYPVPLDDAGNPRPETLDGLIRSAKAAGADWVYFGPDSFMAVNRQAATDAAKHYKLPNFVSAEVYIRSGSALTGLVSRYYSIGQLCGYQARKILVDGIQPRDIPYETLRRFTFLVNLDTAKELDMFPPLPIINLIEPVNP